MSVLIVCVVMRLLVAGICAVGAAYVAAHGQKGWGWLIVATIVLGCVSASTKDDSK